MLKHIAVYFITPTRSDVNSCPILTSPPGGAIHAKWYTAQPKDIHVASATFALFIENEVSVGIYI